MIEILLVRPEFDRPSQTSEASLHQLKSSWNLRCHVWEPGQDLLPLEPRNAPDLLIADSANTASPAWLGRLRDSADMRWGPNPHIPILALVHPSHLGMPDSFRHADDFQCPPYSPSELHIRALALLQGRIGSRSIDGLLQFPGTRIHTHDFQAEADNGYPVPLTTREFELLAFLAKNRGRFFPRHLLIERVWGADFEGGERTVDVHVRRLRSKLPPDTASLLETRHGFGYGLRAS